MPVTLRPEDRFRLTSQQMAPTGHQVQDEPAGMFQINDRLLSSPAALGIHQI
jgi:hypothetical protein